MAVQPLAPREGRRVEDRYEGLPLHLRLKVIEWLEDRLAYPQPTMATAPRPDVLDTLALSLRIVSGSRGPTLGREILTGCMHDEEYCLDVIHLLLQLDPTRVDYLEALLAFGGSAWMATDTGLRRRVDVTAASAFERATEPSDIASSELSEAWSNAYNREPDASEAWDHAIKAVESVPSRWWCR